MTALGCPICQSQATKLCETQLYDDRYGYPGFYDLRRCPVCEHRFLDAVFSAAELGRLYSEFYPRAKLDLEQWRPAAEMRGLRRWLGRGDSAAYRGVPRGVKVLDVGCGFGQSLGYHRNRGCEVWGVEADENIRRVGERFGFNVRVGLFRAEDYPRDYFDYVTLDQVIEHSADPVGLLRDAATVLRPGGTVILGTPNACSLTARLFGQRWVHFHTPYHLQLFSAQSLKRAAATAGLEVVWVRQITNPRWYGFQWLHLLARPEPGVPSLFWTEGHWPPARRVVRKCISGLGRLGLNQVCSFLLDGLGRGDNLMAMFRKKST